tara:strand:+ start:138 stop:635 length:498 start_codon:yes stop_codon:yes gene_type:complete
MAKFGKRFRKAKERRQQRRADILATWQDQRTERIGLRQAGKTDRSGIRNWRKADIVKSKADGGYFLPQSVQARQDSLQTGMGIAKDVGMLAMGIPPLGGLGLANGGQSSPYGSGYATSGMEEEYYQDDSDIDRYTSQNIQEWIAENMVLVAIGAGGLLYLLTRKK